MEGRSRERTTKEGGRDKRTAGGSRRTAGGRGRMEGGGRMLLVALIVVCVGQSDAQPAFGKDENCKDLYNRHCKMMSPDRCYLGYNVQLCCATCTEYQRLYSSQVTDVVCPYGDRDPRCVKMRPNLCYNIYNRYQCCSTCASIRTDMEDCRYGDRDLQRCPKVKPYECYTERTRQACCATCAKYYTGKEGCEYGDRMKFYRKNSKLYTCQAYIGYYGYGRCLPLTTNRDFRHSCCHSCNDMSTMRMSARRRNGYWRLDGR